MKYLLFLLAAAAMHAEPWWAYRLSDANTANAPCALYQDPNALYDGLVRAGLDRSFVEGHFPLVSWASMTAAVAVRHAGKLGMPPTFLTYTGTPGFAVLAFANSADSAPGILVQALLRKRTPGVRCEVREQPSSGLLPAVLTTVFTSKSGGGKADGTQGEIAQFGRSSRHEQWLLEQLARHLVLPAVNSVEPTVRDPRLVWTGSFLRCTAV